MLLTPIRLCRVCISHQSDRHIRVCILHRSDCHIRVCISHQSEHRFWFFCLRGVQRSNGGSEGAVRRMESSFRMRNVGFSVILTRILPRFLRNAILLDS